jgi:hypothetical protein
VSSILDRLPRRRPLGPGMALYLLSPVVAELLCGSTPLVIWPFFGWALALLYGGGAILIREYSLRWGKGWPTILALGAAYGIVEEGIACRTFFDIGSPALAAQGDWGWAGGVNWVFATHLTLYHAIVSIAIPIFLVGLAFPERRTEPWVDGRWLRKAAVGYVAIVAFWVISYQRPVDGWYLIAALLACVPLVLLARRLPARIRPRVSAVPAPSPRRVALVVYAAVLAVFLLAWCRGLGLNALGACLAMPAVAAVSGWWLLRGSVRPGWTDRQRFAVVVGALGFLLSISWAIDMQGFRGQVAVAIVTAWLLRREWRRLRSAEAESATARASLEYGSPAA